MVNVKTFRAFKGPNGEPNGFGLAALQRARLAGFSDAEILARVEAEGLTLGEKAKQNIEAVAAS